MLRPLHPLAGVACDEELGHAALSPSTSAQISASLFRLFAGSRDSRLNSSKAATRCFSRTRGDDPTLIEPVALAA
jgi:hypothetical protein